MSYQSMQNPLTRNILFVLIACVAFWKFITFSSNIKEDLVWFNNSDQNSWVIYSSLDFNDGQPSKYISHPGVASSFVYGWGYRFMKLIGQVDVSKSSDLAGLNDPISAIPQLYKVGSWISIMIILLCSLLVGCIVFVLFSKQWYLSVFAAVMTLFSCGFIFHSVMLRNELTSVFYFLLACLLFVIPHVKPSNNIATTSAIDSSSIWYLVSGFCFGLAYFSKSQIVLTAVLFFIYLLYTYLKTDRTSCPSFLTSVLFLIGHICSFAILNYFYEISIPIFWKLVYGLCLLLSICSLVFRKYSNSSILSFINLVSRFSLGFTLSIPYVLTRGLGSEARSQEKVMIFTSFWNPGATSIQAQTMDKDVSSIITRFMYFMQSYFVESILVVTVLLTVYLLIKKDKKWLNYALGIGLVVICCYLNSLRSNMLANLGRSVFKYIIYIDVAVILLAVATYKDVLQIFAKHKSIVHMCFWILLVAFGLNNTRRVAQKTNWDWTTYADLVYPERWLLPGSPPTVRKILKEKYKGFVNGHDRVIFGDELPRNGEIEIPGGERHLQRIQKLSIEPYVNRMQKLFDLNDEGIKQVENMESRLLNVKIIAFKNGDNYESVLEQVTEKRKFLYRKILKPVAYNKYIKMTSSGRISVPF